MAHKPATRRSGRSRPVLTLVITDAPVECSPQDVSDAFKQELEGTPGLQVVSVVIRPGDSLDPLVWVDRMSRHL